MIILQQGTQGKGGSMTEVAGAQEIGKEALLDAYRVMRTIREFEERLHTEFATGDIPGFVHLYAGEEAIAAGVCAHLDDEDYVASTHRGHGHSIAKGCDVKGMMLEIFGKDEGLCRGKGGSMHIADLDKGMLGANGIVGGGPPLVCGAGLSAKVRGTIDGHDFFAGYKTAGEAIRRAREGGGPTLVEFKVNRYYGNFEGDSQTY